MTQDLELLGSGQNCSPSYIRPQCTCELYIKTISPIARRSRKLWLVLLWYIFELTNHSFEYIGGKLVNQQLRWLCIVSRLEHLLVTIKLHNLFCMTLAPKCYIFAHPLRSNVLIRFILIEREKKNYKAKYYPLWWKRQGLKLLHVV